MFKIHFNLLNETLGIDFSNSHTLIGTVELDTASGLATFII